MYKVLLLTDFSAASQHAIAYAQTLFDDVSTDFCLLHVFPLEPELGYGSAFLLADERETTEKSLEKLQQTITQQPVPAYHTYRNMVAVGDLEGAVAQLVKQEAFDAVVVGATGAGQSKLFGSVATGIIRRGKTNVLVIPASAAIRPLKQVVLATNYQSVNDAESLVLLKELVSRKAAQLTLLTIEKPGKPDQKPSEVDQLYVEHALEATQNDEYIIRDEDVQHGIDAYLDTHTVDLLVMIPHHKSVVDVLLNNSVTRSVAFNPRVPLLALYDTALADKAPTSAKSDDESILFPTYF